MSEYFLDTSYVLALSSPPDQYHDVAVSLARRIEKDGSRLITTRAVLLEVGNALAKQRYRAAAIVLLSALETDGSVEIVSLSDDLYDRSHRLYRERPDKEWGLTDCVSFVVMEERGLTAALTADAHFRQAGFDALLLSK